MRFECVVCFCLGAIVARRSDAHSIPFQGRQQEKRPGRNCRRGRDLVERAWNIPAHEISRAVNDCAEVAEYAAGYF
jgi:hypothetical protein